MMYTKKFATSLGFDQQGNYKQEFTETTYELDDFTEYFIHYLSDHLQTLVIDPKSDGLELLKEFKNLYIQCMLDAKYQYQENHYTPP